VTKRVRSEKSHEKRRRVVRAAAGVACVTALVGLVAANVATVLLGDTVESFLSSDVVDVTPEQSAATAQAGRALAERIEGEGLVLVRNEDATLPLPADVNQVNVFGWGSTQWVASGSGSGQVAGDTVGLLDALSERGISYNTQLTDMYRSFCGARAYQSAGALNSRDSEFCRLYEPSVYDKSCYSDDLLSQVRRYSDTALVVISRVAGESIDCPSVQYKVSARDGSVDTDATRGYLELSSEEEALLRYVGANYEHVVVLVNSTNVMELGELETIPGIDAALLVGTTGEVGAAAVVGALWGDVNPSGRTADTYAYDLSTSASWANAGTAGEGLYTNADGLYPADGTLNANVGVPEAYDGVRFVDYVEGIYVGYRWYETADAEGFWNDVSNAHGAGYDGVVQYPFGHGLSYTSFSWKVTDRSVSLGMAVGRTSDLSLTVRVTNTGQVAGKDVVELYCSPPYVDGGIEKSSTVLVAYEKTKLLAPGESQDVTLSFTLDDVASYDCYDANQDGFTGYELDGGSYVVELKKDAHTLADCEGAQTTVVLPRTVRCEDSLATGSTVGNRFTGGAAVDGVSVDGSNSDANITYLTRADFSATFPRASDPDREMTDSVATLNLYGEQQVAADALGYVDAAETTSLEQPARTVADPTLVLYRNGKLTYLGRLLGQDYTNATWDDVLDNLSVSDMKRLVLHGYLATGALDELGKPRTKEVDGPAQVGSFNQLSYGVGYPAPSVLAQTWNADLARAYGQQVGMECAVLGVDGWYAPCANVHRTPLGGRNYEYFSEDPLVCGTMASSVVGGSLDAGTYCYLKHFAVNNQDSYRDSLYTWLTEQSLREIYLTPFRLAVKQGATGLMTAYNRIGATWAGGNKALLTDVLRGEWGFDGTVITDYCDHQQYMNADQALRAGGDLYMDGVFRNGSFACGYTQEELSAAAGTPDAPRAASYLTNLRRATKDVLYTWLNARETNLSYNEDAGANGGVPLERPVKAPGFDYMGTALAVADAVASLAVVGWVHRRLERRRS
jgi:beta-glucosidase